CFAIVGDGEMNEGPIWEAILFAAHHRLSNLLMIVDANGYQAMGTTDEVIHLGDIAEKLRAFGWETQEASGHDEAALDHAIGELRESTVRRPRAIVARTVKGQGVSFMANDNRWHYTRLTPETYARALSELDGPERKVA